MANMRDASKQHFESSNSAVDINLGCAQRIADALEKMASSYDKLRESRDWYKAHYEEGGRMLARSEHRIRALKGVITRMKRRS